MMYQVQFRQDDGPWQNYGYPAAVLRVDHLRAQCHREHPDCDTRVIRGTTQGEMQDHESEQQSWEDRRRLAIEEGQGGDRDVPYVYKPPLEWSVRDRLSRLLGRVQRGEVEP